METSVEGDCHETSDSKSMESKLRRTELSIDLNLPLPEIVDGEDCQPFSIHQHDAEMKKIDMEIDSPFKSSRSPSEQLHSLDVSKYKRWWCANCTHKIGADGSAGDNNGDASMNTGSTNFVYKAGVRVEETSSPATMGISSKQFVSGYSLQIPLEGKNNDHETNGSGFNILIQPSHASPSIEKVEHHLMNNNISLHTNNDFDLRNFPEDRHASSHMHMVPEKNLQRGSSSKGKDNVQMLFGMEMATSQLENKLYYKEKLRQTLRGFMGARKHIDNDKIQTKNTPNCPLTILKDNKSCGPLKTNGVESRKSRVNPIVKQSILVLPDKFSRNGLMNFNRTIDLKHRQQIHISPNSLQWGCHQNQRLVETAHPRSKINLKEILDHSYATISQENQRRMNVTERGPSSYVPPMGDLEMFKNRHEMSHLKTQNIVFPWVYPGSTNFHPLYGSVGFLQSSTTTTQMKEQQIKLSNSKVSSLVPTRWSLHPVKKSNVMRLPISQNTTFQHYNIQNYLNHENKKRGQAVLGSLKKGRTISHLKSANSMRAEDQSSKGMGSLNPFLSEGMSMTHFPRYQERPLTPYNIHPPFQTYENPSIYSGSFLLHHELKKSSSAYMGGFTEVQSSRQHVSYLKDQGISRGSQEKKRKAHALSQFDGRKLKQSASSSGLMRTTKDSGSKVNLMQDDNISKLLEMGICSICATVLPINSIAKKDPLCLLNQNPADIVDVDDERYFRTAEDQRIRNKSSLWPEKSGVNVKLDGRQRQR